MDTDQEGLLSNRYKYNGDLNSSSSSSSLTSKWKKNVSLIFVAIFIICCLTIYLYLNIKAIDEEQLGTDRYKPLSRRKPMLDHESIFSDSGPSMIKLSDLLAHCIVALRIAGKEVVRLSLANNDRLDEIKSKGKTLEGVDDVVTGADLKSHRMILNTIKDSYRRLNVVSEEDSTIGFENTSAEDDILPIDRTEFAGLLRSDLHEIESQHGDRGALIAQHETLVWIDPLDATKEYSENLTNYVTLMACIVHKSTPIAGVIYKPFTNETYWSMMEGKTEGHQSHHHHSPDLTDILSSSAAATAQNFPEQKSQNIRIIVSRSHAGDVKNILKGIYDDRVDIISAGGSGYKTIELIKGNVDAYMHLTHIKKWDICAPQAILNSIRNGKLTDLSGNRIEFDNPREKLVKDGLIASVKQNVHQDLVELTKNLRVQN